MHLITQHQLELTGNISVFKTKPLDMELLNMGLSSLGSLRNNKGKLGTDMCDLFKY